MFMTILEAIIWPMWLEIFSWNLIFVILILGLWFTETEGWLKFKGDHDLASRVVIEQHSQFCVSTVSVSTYFKAEAARKIVMHLDQHYTTHRKEEEIIVYD